MWFRRIIIKRKLASSDAAVRLAAIPALDMNNDIAILQQLAAADCDAAVRSAAIVRFADPEMLLALKLRERDPEVLALIAERVDQLYGEQALQACAEDRECDAFDRIENLNTLVRVALHSRAPHLLLAAGARLSAMPELWLKFVAQLEDDHVALELYKRNAVDPESPAANYLLNAAASPLLREFIAGERKQLQVQREASIAMQNLIGAIEQAADRGDAEAFESLAMQFRALPQVDENIKTRFMAARYRLARAYQQRLADQERLAREETMAGELFAQLKNLENSGNWKLIRQVADNWKRLNLDNSPAAGKYAESFNNLAATLLGQADIFQQAYNKAVSCAAGIWERYTQFLNAETVPPLEERQQILSELESCTANLNTVPAEVVEYREKIMEAERELRRRARAEAQARDIARWEHYTLKLDICSALEKLMLQSDDKLFEVAKNFRALRERWGSIGPVPNEKFEELRTRYHNICAALHERLEKFFNEINARQQQAKETKLALLNEAETLSGSEDWNKTSTRLKELQELWKSAGSAGGAVDRELFEKFHTACDAFFVRRNAAWEERKKSFFAAAARKKELCEAAEALLDKPFMQAKTEIAALRESWKNIPSAGNDDRILYTRFNRAIENVFAANREAGDEARRQSEIICTDLAEILNIARAGDTPVKEIEQSLLENQQRWESQSIRPARDAAEKWNSIYEELQKELCQLHHLDAMHQLESASQLESVIDPGDDNDKLIDHLARRLKVCGELEERLRECSIISGGGDLARELQSAITGNFGGSDYQLTIAELDEFLRRFVAVGQVPPDAREAVFERFRTLYGKALTELQKTAEKTEKSREFAE